MRVAVLGGSGFIGKRFVELYRDKFSEVISLSSKDAPLHNYQKLLATTKNIDVLVHTAFDHSYKSNLIGIQNVLKVCRENNIEKLVYLSTVSVYNPDFIGVLDETAPYSKLNDPYSKEKRKIEEIIEKYKDDNIDIIILQPTIVYGFGGNWTKYAFHGCKSRAILLPENGEGICNAVYVDDVAMAIYNSCIRDIKFEKILISGEEKINWREFYKKHCEILTSIGLKSNSDIQNINDKNEFHPYKIIDLIFMLWYKSVIGNVFNLMIDILKEMRSKKYKNDMKEFFKSDILDTNLIPIGITRKVHSCQFKVDISKAKRLLDYQPMNSFNIGINKTKKEAEEFVK